MADALLELARAAARSIGPKATEAVEWLREAAIPPAGLTLHVIDGSSYTGLVLVERNRVVLMLAAHDPRGGHATPSVPKPQPNPIDRYVPSKARSLFEHEAPPWDEEDGYWRR